MVIIWHFLRRLVYDIKLRLLMNNGIQKISWKDLSASVAIINPRLATVIDKINPDDSMFLYKVSYPFGATIVEDGLFYVPLASGKLVPINDSEVASEVQNNLQYAETGLPAGILLKNSYEVFIRSGENLLPVVTASPGSILALWKQLDHKPAFHPIKIFSITAGARNLFMLPNIGEAMSHHNLKRDYNVHQQPPKHLLDQWSIFKSIAEHERSNWRLELILFPGIWLEKAKFDPAWHDLYLLFLEDAWLTSSYERNQIFYEFALSLAQEQRNLKPNPYLLDTTQHLLSLALGSMPGFKPATNELMGPIQLIQEAYASSYGLKKYVPTMMHPAHFNLLDPSADPVYYSLQLPTTISFSPRSRQLFSTLFDLRELRYILNIFIEEIAKNRVGLDGTIVSEIPKLVDFDFFHSKPDQHNEIHLSPAMMDGDAFLASALHKGKTSEFASNAAFLRGCVRIRRKRLV